LLQAPCEQVSVWLTRAVPEIAGRVVLTGAETGTGGVTAPELAEAEPPPLLAVTTQVIERPPSAATSVYCAPVANADPGPLRLNE
jgi:hypothetical protein